MLRLPLPVLLSLVLTSCEKPPEDRAVPVPSSGSSTTPAIEETAPPPAGPPLATNPFPDRPLPATRPADSLMTVAEPEQSFGHLWEGDQSLHRFWFRNDGQKPLVIDSVKHSCGCTSNNIFVLRGDRAERISIGRRIEAGEVGHVDILFDSLGQVDKKRLRATLTVNNRMQGKVTLQLTGQVESLFKVSPPILKLEDVVANQGGEGTVQVTCALERPFEVLGFAVEDAGLAFDCRAPDPARPHQQDLTIRFLPGGTEGMKTSRLMLRVQLDGESVLRLLSLPLRANLVGDLAVKPDTLSLGSVPVGEGRTAPIRFTGHGGAWEITAVEVLSSKKQYITTRTLAGEQDGQQILEVTLSPECPEGVLSGSIQVSTTVASHPTVRIPFSGFVER